ncbi:AfsR/SARP family transcriptional regulator [Kribbella deserti]|uniref:BTAD domain-containing putative transcriptional regulator n=1 Tax=Kribbella deserti TaxID=1926257 RepID=A0ABV6QQM6_9ACTN
MLEEALGCWRGPVLADLGEPLFAEPDRARLAELRLVAFEDRAEAELVLGRHQRVIGELESCWPRIRSAKGFAAS